MSNNCPVCLFKPDIRCDETHCDIAGPVGVGVCRICWLRLNKPPSPPSPPSPPREMLGDKISSALSSVGITKERVSEWIGKPCNCSERQKKLNELHQWAEDSLAHGIDKAKSLLNSILGR